MLDENTSVQYKKIRMQKVNNQPAEIMYNDNNKKIYRKLSNREYYLLLEQFRPTIDFALPDRMIQELIHNNKFIPKFTESRNYTLDDLKETIKDGNEMKFKKKKQKKRQKRQNKKNKKKMFNKRRTHKKISEPKNVRDKIKKKANIKKKRTRKNKK